MAFRVRIGDVATGPPNTLMVVTDNAICADMPTTNYSIPKNFVFNCERYILSIHTRIALQKKSGAPKKSPRANLTPTAFKIYGPKDTV